MVGFFLDGTCSPHGVARPACGRRFRTFNMVDNFNREALHIEVDTSITSQRLVRIFEQLQRDRGLPQVLRFHRFASAHDVVT